MVLVEIARSFILVNVVKWYWHISGSHQYHNREKSSVLFAGSVQTIKCLTSSIEFEFESETLEHWKGESACKLSWMWCSSIIHIAYLNSTTFKHIRPFISCVGLYDLYQRYDNCAVKIYIFTSDKLLLHLFLFCLPVFVTLSFAYKIYYISSIFGLRCFSFIFSILNKK